MPAVRIPAGVKRGEDRASIPGRWHTVSLVRWTEGNLKPVGGWERITPTPFASIGRAGVAWYDANYNFHRAVLCDANVYRQQNQVWTEITPTDLKSAESIGARGYGSGNYGKANYGRDTEDRGGTARFIAGIPVSFNIDNWNTELLFGTSADGRIFSWAPGQTTTPVPITADAGQGHVPTLVQAFIVTEEHHLMCFGGDGFPNRIAWSDQGFRTRWNYADTTGQAGFKDLEGAGTIYCARRIPGGILVFTQTSVWLVQYIGSPYFYGATRISEHLVPISPQAVAVAAGKAYWMTPRGFAKYEGGIVSPMISDLDFNPANNMDLTMATRRVCSGFNGAYNEIWWFYPSNTQNTAVPENDKYIIYHVTEGWWADGTLARSFFVASPIEGVPFAGSPNKHIYQHEKGWMAEGVSRGDSVYAEVTSLSFDDGENIWTVTQMQGGGAGMQDDPTAVKFTFSGATVRGVAYRLFGSWAASVKGWVPARFSARDFAIRISQVKDVAWSVGVLTFTTIKRGMK